MVGTSAADGGLAVATDHWRSLATQPRVCLLCILLSLKQQSVVFLQLEHQLALLHRFKEGGRDRNLTDGGIDRPQAQRAFFGVDERGLAAVRGTAVRF